MIAGLSGLGKTTAAAELLREWTLEEQDLGRRVQKTKHIAVGDSRMQKLELQSAARHGM